MIITKKYAMRLVADGKAEIVGHVYEADQDRTYMIINRYDLQRTDHAAI